MQAHLPNPGRLWELLFPGTPLYLRSVSGTQRKTAYSVVAALKQGRAVPLNTLQSNALAEELINTGQIKSLNGYSVVGTEVPFGNSRFDLLLKGPDGYLYLEVKSCTLSHQGVAMFPDAVTERGRRHLQHLATLPPGMKGAVLFIVYDPQAQIFLPDYHTDPAFADTFLQVRSQVRFIPITVDYEPGSDKIRPIQEIPVQWEILKRENQDRGVYLLVLYLSTAQTTQVGKLGSIYFPNGYYVYVGSASRNLNARLKRHKSTRKTLHWHIDYLRSITHCKHALPIRTPQKIECLLAQKVSTLADSKVHKFGCTDCRCPSHLFYFKSNPMQQQEFVTLLLNFRMERLLRNTFE